MPNAGTLLLQAPPSPVLFFGTARATGATLLQPQVVAKSEKALAAAAAAAAVAAKERDDSESYKDLVDRSGF